MFASSESRTPVARKEVDDRLVAPASTYVHTVLETCGQGGRTADLPLSGLVGDVLDLNGIERLTATAYVHS